MPYPKVARSLALVSCMAAALGSSCAFFMGGKHADDPSARSGQTLTGQAAMGDWTTDAPGVRRKITVADLPKPYQTRSVDNGPRQVRRPDGAWPKVPRGFKVEEFITG